MMTDIVDSVAQTVLRGEAKAALTLNGLPISLSWQRCRSLFIVGRGQ